MALHDSLISLLKDSLPEFLQAAAYCINPREQHGGLLGCPAAALMFSIADSLGSYHRGRLGFTVNVDGKETPINNDGFQHYFIFNSDYYGLALSEATIRRLYNSYRCPLLHNSAMVFDGSALFLGDRDSVPFVLDQQLLHVNLPAFLRVTERAVQTFIDRVDNIVPGSDQERIIHRKR